VYPTNVVCNNERGLTHTNEPQQTASEASGPLVTRNRVLRCKRHSVPEALSNSKLERRNLGSPEAPRPPARPRPRRRAPRASPQRRPPTSPGGSAAERGGAGQLRAPVCALSEPGAEPSRERRARPGPRARPARASSPRVPLAPRPTLRCAGCASARWADSGAVADTHGSADTSRTARQVGARPRSRQLAARPTRAAPDAQVCWLRERALGGLRRGRGLADAHGSADTSRTARQVGAQPRRLRAPRRARRCRPATSCA